MKISKHSSRKHSEFSPSAAKRWMTCPGSVRLSRLAPPLPESPYAKEGTEAHECLEFIVRRYGDLNAAAEEAKTKWPAEMVEHAVNSATRLFSPDVRPSPDTSLLIETRVEIRSITHRLYGTLDYAWLDHWGTLTIIDYKYGAGVAVAAVDDDGEPNPQLMLYALGVAEKFQYDFERVRLVIIQPRTCRDGEDSVNSAFVALSALKAFKAKVSAAVKEANRADAPLVAGDHCRWCPALATCPESRKAASKKAGLVFDNDERIVAAPKPETLNFDKLPRILSACDQLEVWIKRVREHALTMAERGTKIPGYKLVAKRAQRVWLPDAEKAAYGKFGNKIYDFKPAAFMSPAQLEKAIGVSAKDFTRKHTSAVSSGFNLVPEKDARNEITSTAVWDFEQ